MSLLDVFLSEEIFIFEKVQTFFRKSFINQFNEASRRVQMFCDGSEVKSTQLSIRCWVSGDVISQVLSQWLLWYVGPMVWASDLWRFSGVPEISQMFYNKLWLTQMDIVARIVLCEFLRSSDLDDAAQKTLCGERL